MSSRSPASPLAARVHREIYGECAHSYEWATCSCDVLEDADWDFHSLDHCEASKASDYPKKVCRHCGESFYGLAYGVGPQEYAPLYDSDMNLALDLMVRFDLGIRYDDVAKKWSVGFMQADNPAELICRAALRCKEWGHDKKFAKAYKEALKNPGIKDLMELHRKFQEDA